MHRPASNGKARAPLCPCCGKHHTPLAPSQYRLRRSNVIKLNFCRSGQWRIRLDAEGRKFVIVLLALDIPPEDFAKYAPLGMTAVDLMVLTKEARRFDPTPDNIGIFLGVTSVEREKWKLDYIHPCDETWDEVQRRRAKANNAASNERKRRARAARKAQIATQPMREAAILNSADRVVARDGASTPFARSNMRAMTKEERAVFPAGEAAFEVAFYRVAKRLVDRGALVRRKPVKGRGDFFWPADDPQFRLSPEGVSYFWRKTPHINALEEKSVLTKMASGHRSLATRQRSADGVSSAGQISNEPGRSASPTPSTEAAAEAETVQIRTKDNPKRLRPSRKSATKRKNAKQWSRMQIEMRLLRRDRAERPHVDSDEGVLPDRVFHRSKSGT